MAFAVLLISCGDATTTETKKAEDIPVEEKLAVIDDIYDKNSPEVKKMKTLLEELSAKYDLPKDSIGEYTYRAKSVLKDKGIEETNLSIMEQINKTEKTGMAYKEVLAMYLLLRTGGN